MGMKRGGREQAVQTRQRRGPLRVFSRRESFLLKDGAHSQDRLTAALSYWSTAMIEYPMLLADDTLFQGPET